MEHNIADIVAHPETYGFRWIEANVEKDGMDLGKVPLIEHTDRALIERNFGEDYFLNAANSSQSPRVNAQGVCRAARWGNRKLSLDDLKVMVVETVLLGKRSPRKTRTVEKHYGADGVEYPNREAAIEASKRFYEALNTK